MAFTIAFGADWMSEYCMSNTEALGFVFVYFLLKPVTLVSFVFELDSSSINKQ